VVIEESGWIDGGWRTQHEECCRVGRDGSGLDVVLIGDSLVQGWGGPGRSVAAPGAAHWEEIFGGRRAGNLGIAGDRVKHVLWRLDHGALDGLDPRFVLLHVGTNDLADGLSPSETAEGVLAVAREIRARAPGARLLLHGLLPRGADESDPLQAAVRATNSLLAQRVAELGPGAEVLDPAATFTDAAGALRADLYDADTLHLSPAGYAAWGRALAPKLGKIPPAFADGATHSFEPAWITVERQAGLILAGALAVAAAVAIGFGAASGRLDNPLPALLVGAWVVMTGAALFLASRWPSWEYRVAGYRVYPDRVEVWRGLLWRKAESVPTSRVQYTDVQQGPLQRRHGIATLVVHTAGTAGAEVEVPGLLHARAIELRDWLVSQSSDDAV